MNVHVSRAPMQLELEVVVLQVAQAVGHFFFAARDRLRPELLAAAGNGHRTGHGSKIRIDHQLGSNRTGAQLRSRQVEVVLLFEAMVRELVALGHAHSIGPAIGTNHIHHRDLGLLATVLRVGGDEQRLAVRVHDRAITFVEPLRGNPDFPVTRAAAFQAPAKHLHAVGEFLLLGHVHGRPVARAAQVGQARARYQAAGNLLWVIDGREQLPLARVLRKPGHSRETHP